MKIQRVILVLVLLLAFAGAVFANDDPYTVALERIREAAESRTTVLHLNLLGLTELPPEIGQLTWLRELSLSQNLLRDLPPEFANLQELRQLELSHNNFEYLPLVVTQLNNLQWLNLGYNNLLALPAEIGSLHNLTRLYAHNNSLSYLPYQIGDLSRLERLYLNHNYLTELPEEIGNLSYLQMLVIDDNQLEDIPDVIDDLPYLRVSVVSLITPEEREAMQDSSPSETVQRNSNPSISRSTTGISATAPQSPDSATDMLIAVSASGLLFLASLFVLLLVFKPAKRKRKEF